MKSTFLSTIFLAFVAACAQATVYDCAVNPGSANGGWLTEQYFFEYQEDRETIEIYDGLIEYFNDGKPVTGKVTGRNAAKISCSWAPFVIDGAGQRTKMDLRAVLYFANKEFSVQAKPVGYIDQLHARGVCKVAE